MPELPEVETICRGLRASLSAHAKIKKVELVRRDLRVMVPKILPMLWPVMKLSSTYADALNITIRHCKVHRDQSFRHERLMAFSKSE